MNLEFGIRNLEFVNNAAHMGTHSRFQIPNSEFQIAEFRGRPTHLIDIVRYVICYESHDSDGPVFTTGSRR